jgi:hypothetical protein
MSQILSEDELEKNQSEKTLW